MNFFKQFTRSSKDELIGIWDREADEMSFIWGWGFEFLPDGKGLHRNWGSDVEASEINDETFQWARLGPTTINIQSRDGTWEIIDYTIQQVRGYYDAKYWKLSNKGENHFWYMHESVYQPVR